MSEVKVNKISPRSGTDVTLGDASDTFTIPASATLDVNGTIDVTGATVTGLSLASVEDDIALLGFKVATNGSLAKYDLVDQTIDAFEDASGIDTSTSTDEVYNSSGKYYSSVGAETATTITTGMCSNSGGTFNVSNWLYGSGSNAGFLSDGAAAGTTITLDLGSGNEKRLTKGSIYWENTTYCVWKMQYSSDNVSYTDVSSQSPASWGGNPVTPAATIACTWDGPGAYRYWRLYKTNGATSGSWQYQARFWDSPINSSMTLVSNATTAEAVPTKGDLVMTYTNGAGTATINTDIKGWVSRDDGTTYTQFTLADEGDTGGHTILTAHDLDISGQPSGTSMRYKITTHNQSAAKETRIQAVSLGWS